MDGNFRRYNWVDSANRIDEILSQPQGQFEEVDALPARDRLTFTNGFYAYCSAIFVDIRNSSGLTQKYKRPVLAKIYRAFISEMVAVLNSDPFVREVSIVGDCVWAVYNTPRKQDIDDVFSIACRANTLRKLLSNKLVAWGAEELRFGIGVDYGRALMIKAGHMGSTINDVVYMGDVVNRAAHLAHKAGRGLESPIWVGSTFQQNLNEDNARWIRSRWDGELGTIYAGDVILTDMNDWIDQNV